jgi:hypothetical protein
LRLNRDGRAVTAAALLETAPVSNDSAMLATISGDDLYYLVAQRPGTQDSSTALTNVRVRRIKLQ